MLRKLMKHEFRATGRVMLPLFLLLLATAVGANISTRGLMETDNGFLTLLGTLLVIAFAFALAGVCIMSIVLMVQRFYKNLLQDEGYVMMTLPVSVHQHVWSKILVSTVWFVATAVVAALACCIMAYEIGMVEQFFDAVWAVLRDLRFGDYALDAASFLAELLALVFLSCCAACLQFYAALAVGHSFAGHKMVWSVVAFFGFSFILNLLGGGFVAVMDATGLDYTLTQMLPRISSPIAVTHLMMLVMNVLALIPCVIYYFLTTYFLQKRLNLE